MDDACGSRSRTSSFSSGVLILTPVSSRSHSPVIEISGSGLIFDDDAIEGVPLPLNILTHSAATECEDQLADTDERKGSDAVEVPNTTSEDEDNECFFDTSSDFLGKSADEVEPKIVEGQGLVSDEKEVAGDTAEVLPCTCYKAVIGEKHSDNEKCNGKMPHGDTYRAELKELASELKASGSGRVMNLDDISRYLRMTEPLAPAIKKRMPATISTKSAITEALKYLPAQEFDTPPLYSATNLYASYDGKISRLLDQIRGEIKELRKITIMRSTTVDLSEVHDAYRLLEIELLEQLEYRVLDTHTEQDLDDGIHMYEDRIKEVKMVSEALLEELEANTGPKHPVAFQNPMAGWKKVRFEVGEDDSNQHETSQSSTSEAAAELEDGVDDDDGQNEQPGPSTDGQKPAESLDFETELGLAELKWLTRLAQLLSMKYPTNDDYREGINELKEKIDWFSSLKEKNVSGLQKQLATKDLRDLVNHYADVLIGAVEEEPIEMSHVDGDLQATRSGRDLNHIQKLILLHERGLEGQSIIDKQIISDLESQVSDLLAHQVELEEALQSYELSQTDTTCMVSEQIAEISELHELVASLKAERDSLSVHQKLDKKGKTQASASTNAEISQFATQISSMSVMGLRAKVLKLQMQEVEMEKELLKRERTISEQDTRISDLLTYQEGLKEALEIQEGNHDKHASKLRDEIKALQKSSIRQWCPRQEPADDLPLQASQSQAPNLSGEKADLQQEIIRLNEEAKRLRKTNDHKVSLQNADIEELLAGQETLKALNESLQSEINQLYDEIAPLLTSDGTLGKTQSTLETMKKDKGKGVCRDMSGGLVQLCRDGSAEVINSEPLIKLTEEPTEEGDSRMEHLDRHGLLDLLHEESSTLYKKANSDTQQLGLLRMFSKPFLRAQADEIIILKRQNNELLSKNKDLSRQLSEVEELATCKDWYE